MSGEIVALEGFLLLSHIRRHAQPVEQSPEAEAALEACLAAEEKRQTDRQARDAEAWKPALSPRDF